ncbi:S-layer homology domain-containing protein [Kocuria sabuli]|uniref:S-layer homology domain-containing protein n=1 Tax=Kocuria sabuli TaxID=3071448 RepID=UPI0034D77436
MDVPGVGFLSYICGMGPETTVTAWVRGKPYPMTYSDTWTYGWGSPRHWVDYDCMAPGTPILVEGTRRWIEPPTEGDPKAVPTSARVAVWNKSDRSFRHAALPARCGNPSVFTDIGTSHGFYRSVSWAGSNGIVTGGKDGKIRHARAVTREEMAVTPARWGNIGNFGKNGGGYETNIDPRRIDPTIRPRFRDVLAALKYSVEISVLSQIGVINGWSDGTFRPTQDVTRGQTAAFLYRLAGSPAYTPPKTSRFKDVTTRTPFYEEISWMAQSGFTTG